MITFLLTLLGIVLGFLIGVRVVNAGLKGEIANGFIESGGKCYKVEKMEAK